jgi:hypothetical protein
MAKALIGALAAGVGAGATAAIDDRVTVGEWWMIAATALGALAAVYATPNRTTPPDTYNARHDRE